MGKVFAIGPFHSLPAVASPPRQSTVPAADSGQQTPFFGLFYRIGFIAFSHDAIVSYISKNVPGEASAPVADMRKPCSCAGRINKNIDFF